MILLAIISGSGWVLALAMLIINARLRRLCEKWSALSDDMRRTYEALLAQHHPADFLAYAAHLQQRGMAPLVPPPTRGLKN